MSAATDSMEAAMAPARNRLSKRPLTAGQNAQPVMVLGIGKELYGIDLSDVLEVLPQSGSRPCPG